MCKAQQQEDFQYFGIRLAFNMNRIDGLQETIIGPKWPIGFYSSQDNFRFAGSLTLTSSFLIKDTWVAIQPEISFSQRGGIFSYDDEGNYGSFQGYSYDISLKYNFLEVAPTIKLYFPFLNQGLHLLLIPKVSFLLNRDKLFYKSNHPLLGPDLQIQDNLRQVLHGRIQFLAGIALGYDLPIGDKIISLDMRYYLSPSDVMETLPNGYGFRETHNQQTSFELSVGFLIIND